jgi:hypothetical protein
MTESTSISEEALRGAFTQLSDLAEAEYGQTLTELLADDDPVQGDEYGTLAVLDSHDAFWRLGRLIGITVKEPFAEKPEPRTPEQKSQTGARRVWELDQKALDAEHPDWWQYNLLTEFLADTDRVGSFDWLPPQHLAEADQVAGFLLAAQSERGVFGALVKAARPYLCKNPEVREELGKKGRIDADPGEMIAGGASTAAATLIISAVPWLGPAAIPFVAGILLIIAAQGLDSFCSRTLPSPRTDVVET